jgi:hypothetical protein
MLGSQAPYYLVLTKETLSVTTSSPTLSTPSREEDKPIFSVLPCISCLTPKRSLEGVQKS